MASEFPGEKSHVRSVASGCPASSQAVPTWMTSDSEKNVHVPIAEDAIKIESSSDK